TRYTAGLGILELILQDENIQDISINSPIGKHPIYIYHGVHQECETNLIPTKEDAESWATRFRLLSGRPLDEANPVLDTELNVPGGRARVAAITRSLSPDGLGFAFRRHRDRPWTLPLFINTKMIDPFSAGLLWFLIDGARTMLIAGTRSSGKTSFLGAIMVQIMPHIRIVTTEDTLELPVKSLMDLGYNIERLKSRSVITQVETEIPAEEALRTALRLGDSALIVGEVRSREALALYEAMRIGALANVVAGTIHGESAYGVFDRVVNDLGVPPTSFKATDIVIVANMLRSPDGLHSFRRIVELTEVRKHWKEDPMSEGGFVNLLEYSAREDKLNPSKTLLTGESYVLNNIAQRVRDWRGSWDAMWGNITLRAKILETLSTLGKQKPELMEAQTVINSNSMYHLIGQEVKRELGSLDPNIIYERWHEWLMKTAKQI
ncbi:ATPase, T2SS/T4P/T4SS family, partial [Candidatus Aenigmatarchaeota archaeon]